MTHPTQDGALTIGLVVAFALLVTVHVANVFGVFRRRGALPGFGALLLPPLAPYLAARAGMSIRAALWVAAAAVYVAVLVGARA
jgi:hypothetical protein